eukprot:150605-Pleurochrysis_carterae.AAC.2
MPWLLLQNHGGPPFSHLKRANGGRHDLLNHLICLNHLIFFAFLKSLVCKLDHSNPRGFLVDGAAQRGDGCIYERDRARSSICPSLGRCNGRPTGWAGSTSCLSTH